MADTSKLLVIGDSISIDYTPFLAEELGGDWAVVHNEGNAEDSPTLLAGLDGWLAADPDADAIVFNCGLHDIKRDRETGRFQVPLTDYRANLERIVQRLQATGRALTWATITPVNYEWHLSKPFDRREEDVQAYNAGSLQIISRAGIPICDLHAVVEAAGVDECLRPDGVHMVEKASRLLGQKVADCVRTRMEESR